MLGWLRMLARAHIIGVLVTLMLEITLSRSHMHLSRQISLGALDWIRLHSGTMDMARLAASSNLMRAIGTTHTHDTLA